MHVAILGCGYVGLALATQLRARGHEVTGVRRSEEGLRAVEDVGANPVRADVTDPSSLGAVPDVDALVFAASSGGRGAAAARRVYVEGLRTTVKHFAGRAAPPDTLLYTSSTGVYGDHGGAWVDETTRPTPTTDKTAVLLEAEGVAQRATEHEIQPVVVRFGGLYGPDRYRLERYLEGPITAGYLNLLHRADAAGVLRFLLEKPSPPSVLLAVDTEPVDRRELATWLADACGVEAPMTQTVAERLAQDAVGDVTRRRLTTEKRCSNARLQELGYSFEYPTYREGYAAAVDAYRDVH
ncbi:MAG: SDR family oxidoreductase [Halobacteriaceae archaeon]